MSQTNQSGIRVPVVAQNERRIILDGYPSSSLVSTYGLEPVKGCLLVLLTSFKNFLIFVITTAKVLLFYELSKFLEEKS